MVWPIIPGNIPAAAGFSIANAGLFDGSDHMTRVFSAGDQDHWVISVWVQKHTLGTQGHIMAKDTSNQTHLRYDFTNDYIEFEVYSGSYSTQLETSSLYRDLTGWDHIVCVYDSDNATSGDRARLYVNGVRITGFNTETYPSRGTNSFFNAADTHYLGRLNFSPTYDFEGLMAEFVFLDGPSDIATIDATAFGQSNSTTGEWEAIDPTGNDFTGTNSCYLNFSNGANLGEDQVNSNDWTNSGVTQATNTATDQANIWNALNTFTGTLSNGNRKYTGAATTYGSTGILTITKKSYGEFETSNGNGGMLFGLTHTSTDMTSANAYTKSTSFSWLAGTTGRSYYDAGVSDAGNHGGFANGVRCRWAYDPSNGYLWLGDNSGWNDSGDPAAGTNPAMTIPASLRDSMVTFVNTNSGLILDTYEEGDFSYTPPTGFSALTTANMTAPSTVLSDHYKTLIYSGNGTSQSITGVGFAPDLVLIKRLDSTGNFRWYNTIRGAQVDVRTSSTDPETTDSTGLTSFDSDGFSVGSRGEVNASGTDNIISYNFHLPNDASGSTTGAGTAKTYTSKYNADLGLEVIEYTGNGTAGHTIPLNGGNGKAPFMVACKHMTTAKDWPMWHEGLTSSAYSIFFNLTQAQNTTDNNWNSVAPTSSVVTLGAAASNHNNENDKEYLMFVFYETDFMRPVKFEGNANVDGPFKYSNGRPVVHYVKNIDANNNHMIFDDAQESSNSIDQQLKPNLTDASSTHPTISMDFDVAGVKDRSTSAVVNGSSNTHVGFTICVPISQLPTGVPK